METLIVFYSRTGVTKQVAEFLKNKLDCDLEEIEDVKSRKGVLGYIRSGKEAVKKQIPKIKPTNKNPKDYDLVLVGTPNWAGHISSPVRSYLSNNNLDKVGFFATGGSDNPANIFKELEELTNNPKAKVYLRTSEVKKSDFEKLDDFIKLVSKKV